MNNETYAGIMTGDPVIKKRLIEAMEKYGEDRWWMGHSTDRLAYMQLKEDVLLCESEALQKAVEGLLGRKVPFFEFRFDRENIVRSVMETYKEKYKR